jgi:hypothetical protein
VPDFIENHKAGKLRVLGVLGGARQAALPDVPTFTELGLPGLEDMPYYGVFAPAGTPKGFTDTFSAAVAKVIAQPEVRNQLSQMGLTVGHMNAEQLGRRERAYGRDRQGLSVCEAGPGLALAQAEALICSLIGFGSLAELIAQLNSGH